MSRPMKKRRVSALPPCTRFMPQGCEDAPEVTISLEEYECIRLLDYIGMTQEECARQMNLYFHYDKKFFDQQIRSRRSRFV